MFGGAISGTSTSYLPTLIPGIIAMTTLTACVAAGVQLREDMDKGVFDRFRSLPIARIAPLAGPMMADLARYCRREPDRPDRGRHHGLPPRWRRSRRGRRDRCSRSSPAGPLAWIFLWIGTIARSARAVQGMSMMIMFPLAFLSNAFVPVRTLPRRLQTFVNINPVSHLVSATRDLANHAVISSQVGWTLLAGFVVIAIFAPLSVRSYKRHL